MPENLANKIAAGEVVQRPSSAAKELIENALDAGATDISLIVKGAGSELIQVIDNGCGMNPSDAALCFRRHATSKIKKVEDLERIQTLGFRGEALASIAAVAQVELKTKRVTDKAGISVRVNGGRFAGTEPCATPDGTTVSVRNLFYNVPARRNFLKTPATELKHLIETFQFLALSNPTVSFTLSHENNELYRLTAPPEDDFQSALRERIRQLFGNDIFDGIVEVTETTSYLSARGFTALPTLHRRSRGEQFLFVNGRYVKNRSLDHAIMSAYENMIPEGAFPFYAVFLDLDPRHIDVNVHPTKAEVKFDDERGVYGFLRAVVRKALGMAELTPQIGKGHDQGIGSRENGFTSINPRPFSATPGLLPSSSDQGRTDPMTQWKGVSFEDRTDKRPGLFGNEAPGDITDRLYQGLPSSPERSEQRFPSSIEPDTTGVEDTAGDDSLMWQMHDRYILTQIRSGLMILDQNAAHERILYERALQSIKNGFGLSQQLLFPHTIDLNPADYELLKELAPDLRSLGFDLEFFSGRSVAIRGVPADIRTGDERSILEDVLEQFKNYRDTLQLKPHDNLAKSIARRSAISPGKKLSPKEMRALIDQLFMCELPYASPHGHPTMIKISISELEKRFGR